MEHVRACERRLKEGKRDGEIIRKEKV